MQSKKTKALDEAPKEILQVTNNIAIKNGNQSNLNSCPSMNSIETASIDDFIDDVLANQDVIVAFLKKNKESRQLRRLAEQQRDDAIKEINLKNRKIEYLKWRLDAPNTWVPIRNISWLKDFCDMDQVILVRKIGKILSHGSMKLGLNPRKISHPKLGKVNIYHIDVIRHFHRHLVENPGYLNAI